MCSRSAVVFYLRSIDHVFFLYMYSINICLCAELLNLCPPVNAIEICDRLVNQLETIYEYISRTPSFLPTPCYSVLLVLLSI
jgi:hypothetical protein